MVLTQAEIATLQAMVNSGDRAAFYLAYYAMTGNPEALLTAKISTFSETVAAPTGLTTFSKVHGV